MELSPFERLPSVVLHECLSYLSWLDLYRFRDVSDHLREEVDKFIRSKIVQFTNKIIEAVKKDIVRVKNVYRDSELLKQVRRTRENKLDHREYTIGKCESIKTYVKGSSNIPKLSVNTRRSLDLKFLSQKCHLSLDEKVFI